MMKWEELISAERYKRPENKQNLKGRNPYQQDLDRIAYSNAFKRLQDKTQVHALSENDHVRTRLTHSIETASVGRSLGYMVAEEIENLIPEDISCIVQAACFTHDIGNPPFGHLGEEAIGYFFKDKPYIFEDADFTGQQIKDLHNFEGNAQGFRILTRNEMNREGGMQLTYATLGAFTKYPCSSERNEEDKKNYVGCKKYGFFDSEKEYFKEIATKTGLIQRKEVSWCRHPLTFLVEAADDICYSVGDIEDGYEIKSLTFEEAEKKLKPIAEIDDKDQRYNSFTSEGDKIGFLRASAIGNLIKKSAAAFIENEQAILAGTFDKPLIKATDTAEAVKEAKDFAVQEVFRSKNVVRVEIAGFEVIYGLLDAFCKAVIEYEKNMLSPKSERLLIILGQHKLKNTKSRYERILKVTDYIAGMTDHFALNLYRRINGIEL